MVANNHIGIRATAEQKARLENAADDAGLPLSTWVLIVALHVAGHSKASNLADDIKRARELRQ